MMPSSSPQPSTLPLSSGDPAAAPSPAAFRLFITRVADSLRSSLSNRRPWSELLDRSAISKPESLSDATSRIRKNLSYFRLNYLILISSVLALSLLTNPLSLLILLCLLAAWAFLYLLRPSDSGPLVLFGRQFSDRETLGGLVLLTIVVVFLTSVGSILMSALTIGAAIVGLHGAFRVPEDLFLDEVEGGGAATGLLSFLGGAATNAAVGAGPAVAVRV